MAITQISGARVFSRLTADALPITDPVGGALIIGDLLITEDGDKEQYSYGQAGWYQRPLTEGVPNTTGHSIDTATNKPVPDKSTNSAKHVATQAGSVDAYGPHVEDRYLPASVTNSSAADNAAFNTQTSVEGYDAVVFNPTTGDITVQLSIDNGVTFPATTVNNLFVDLGQAATAVADSYKGFRLVATTLGGVGPYMLLLPANSFRFVNEGAVAAVVDFALIGSNPL